jgi:hypothetical protein
VTRVTWLRNYPPEKVADAVLRTVVRNEAVVQVTPEARLFHAMSRFTRAGAAEAGAGAATAVSPHLGDDGESWLQSPL